MQLWKELQEVQERIGEKVVGVCGGVEIYLYMRMEIGLSVANGKLW